MNKNRTVSKIKLCALLGVLLITTAMVEASDWGYEPGDVMPENWGTMPG